MKGLDKGHTNRLQQRRGEEKIDVPFCYPSPIRRDWSAQLGVDQKKKKKERKDKDTEIELGASRPHF